MLMGMIMVFIDDGNGVFKGLLVLLLIGILVVVIGVLIGLFIGFVMNLVCDFGLKLFIWFVGWGNIVMIGGRDIFYFIVFIIVLLLGVCFGVVIYCFFIVNNLFCYICVEEENMCQCYKGNVFVKQSG